MLGLSGDGIVVVLDCDLASLMDRVVALGSRLDLIVQDARLAVVVGLGGVSGGCSSAAAVEGALGGRLEVLSALVARSAVSAVRAGDVAEEDAEDGDARGDDGGVRLCVDPDAQGGEPV